jgi:hypothetical protein
MENDEPMGSTIVETRHINLGIQNYDFQYFCGRTTSYFIHVALARCSQMQMAIRRQLWSCLPEKWTLDGTQLTICHDLPLGDRT